MKNILHVGFLCFILVIATNAQTSETVSELTPVPSNIGEFSKRLPVVRNKIINSDNLKFTVSTELVNLSDNKKGITIVIQVPYKELVFESISGKETTRVSVYGRITSKDKTVDGFFEEKLSEAVDIKELIDVSNKNVTWRKVYELSEGNYQIGIIVKDIISEIRGVKVLRFQIP